MQTTYVALADLHEALANKRFRVLKDMLAVLPAADVMEFLRELTPAEKVIRFRLLDKRKAVEVFSQLDPDGVMELLKHHHRGRHHRRAAK